MTYDPALLGATQLRRLARNVDANDMTPDEIRYGFDHAEAPDLLPIADLAEWATSQPKPKPFVWQGRLPKGDVTKLDGKGGSNKSTGGHQLAACRAAGLPFLGVDLEPGKTLYVTAEDDFPRLHWMQEHICRAIGVDPASLSGKLFLSSVRGQLNNELATFDHEGRIVTTPAFARLKATLRSTGADLLILDNVAHLYAGNENDRGQVTAFVNLLYSLGVTVLLIAHPNKAGDTYSGSTAWLNAIRSQLVIECPDELDPDARTLTVGKANYARPGETLRFRWHNFALWLEDDLPADTRAEIADTIRITGENARFLACLAASTERRRAVSHHPGVNYYAAVFAKMPEAKGNKKPAFERAFERLLSRGEIEIDAQLWQRENRAWKYGIRAVESAPTPPHQPPAPTRTDLSAKAARTDPPLPTVGPGAANGAAPPEDTPALPPASGGEASA